MWGYNMNWKITILAIYLVLNVKWIKAQTATQEFLTPAKSSLSQKELNAYSLRAMEKVKDFTNYLELLTNKEYSAEIRKHSLQPATQMFTSPNNFMEVASTSRKLIKRYPIGSYLRKIQNSSYQKTKISHEDMRWLEPLRRENNGSYTGTIVCEQRFTGRLLGGKEYSDFTTKAYNIVLKREHKKFGSRSLEVWQLYLGDVKIESITSTDRLLQINVEKTAGETINSGISLNSIEQSLKTKQENSAKSISATDYLQHSNTLVNEWSNQLRMQTRTSAQLKHTLKVSRYGERAKNIKLTLQLQHNPFGLGNATTLQYDQSKAYYNVFLKDYLTAFGLLVKEFVALSDSTSVNGKFSGHASESQNMGLSSYEGELGRIDGINYFAENVGKFEVVSIANEQQLNTENLAFLRAFMGSQMLKSVVKNSAELTVGLNKSEDDFSRILTVEILLSNAYKTMWEDLPEDAKKKVIEMLNP